MTPESHPAHSVDALQTPAAQVAMPQDAPIAAVAEEVRHAEPEERPAQPAAVVEPVAERVIEHAVAAPTVSTPPAPPAVSEPIVLPPGLSQVETDAEKVRIAANMVDPAPPPRPPRVRPPLQPISSEPLAQVETRKQA